MKEKLISIRNHFYHAQDSLETGLSLLNELYESLDGFNLIATREGDRIKIEWDGEIDEIQWILDGTVVSLNKMWETTDLDPPKIEDPPYYIGNEGTSDNIKKVTVGTGEWIDEAETFLFHESESTPVTRKPHVEPVEPYPLLITLWDSWKNGYSDFDTVKIGKWDDIQQQYDQGKTVIISASHTWTEKDSDGNYIRDENGNKVLEPEYKWKNRLERLKGKVKDLDPDRYLIFLQDEPFGKSHWTLSDLNRLIQLSKEILPSNARIGMSFTNGSVMSRELPQGLDFYVTPNYPFKTEWAIKEGHKSVSTKQEYDDDIDELISRYRQKIGNKHIYLIGQGFYNTGSGDVKPHEKRWAKPPIEYPQWLYEACWRNKIQGVWWWVYQIKRDHYSGLDEMPEHMQAIEELNEKIPEN